MKRFIYLFPILALLAGCTADPMPDDEKEARPGDASEGVYVSLATRSIDFDREYPYGRGADEELPYILDHFEEGDILYISQQGTSVSPNLYYSNSDITNSDLNPESVRDNLYIYVYQENKDADWNSGYNFVPYVNAKGTSKAVDWGKIRTNGSRGNAFWFYALHQGNGKPNFRINAWQNSDSNIGGSAESLAKMHDLLGAYHATSSLYTRMQFKLYHLLTLTHVTLLVPVKQDEPDGTYSGFDANAFTGNADCGLSSNSEMPGLYVGVPAWYNRQSGATQNGLEQSFNIDWTANRSSDTEAPLAITGGSGNSNFCFYLLKRTPQEPFRLENVKKFYPGAGIETDMVRRYEFIAYTPIQSANKLTNALLSIRLLTPGSSGKLYETPNGANNSKSVDGTFAAYFYYGDTNKKQDQLQEGNDLIFNKQGLYQHLTLYLPRKSNETVLVSAKVLPWNETYTDMTLVPREE